MKVNAPKVWKLMVFRNEDEQFLNSKTDSLEGLKEGQGMQLKDKSSHNIING